MRIEKIFIGCLVILTIFLSGCGLESTKNSTSQPSTKEAVGSVLQTMGKGFAIQNADTVASIYTDNAQWLNAFGDWRVGRIAIRNKLDSVFASSGFSSGKTVGKPTAKIKVINPNLAIGWTYKEIKNQRITGTNKVIPLRRDHSLSVIVKRNGKWKVVAQIFMDEEPHSTRDTSNTSGS